jgi:hypothetical protein
MEEEPEARGERYREYVEDLRSRYPVEVYVGSDDLQAPP